VIQPQAPADLQSSPSDEASAPRSFDHVDVALDSIMRREAKRFALASMAQALAAEPFRRRHESRRAHLQNALAAILQVGSEVAWHSRPVALYLATRARRKAELRYALAELHAAVSPSGQPDWRRQRLLLVGVPAAAAALGLAVRARMSSRPPDPAPE
jgi:hypothetical protein